MKTLTLKIGEKIYTSSRITAWHSLEVIRVYKELASAGEMGEGVSDGHDMSDALESIESAMMRRVNLICEVYGNKFTADEILKNLTNDEIEKQISAIFSGVMGVAKKK